MLCFYLIYLISSFHISFSSNLPNLYHENKKISLEFEQDDLTIALKQIYKLLYSLKHININSHLVSEKMFEIFQD